LGRGHEGAGCERLLNGRAFGPINERNEAPTTFHRCHLQCVVQRRRFALVKGFAPGLRNNTFDPLVRPFHNYLARRTNSLRSGFLSTPQDRRRSTSSWNSYVPSPGNTSGRTGHAALTTECWSEKRIEPSERPPTCTIPDSASCQNTSSAKSRVP